MKSTTVIVLLGLLSSSVVGALGVLEVGLRVWGYYPALQSEYMLESPHLALDDDVIVIPRRLLTPSFYDVPDDAPLIVAIGDSFTQGFPVASEDSYPAVLERLLGQRGVRAHVANAGMGDSGPDQQLRLLETRLLPRLHPAAVVWSLYANDLWDNVLKATYTIDRDGHLRPVSGNLNWLALRQHLFDAPLPSWIRRDSYLFHVLLRATEMLPRLAVPYADRRDPTAYGARKLTLELTAFDRLAAAYGFAPYVLLIAPQSRYLTAADPTAGNDSWTLGEHRKLEALVRDRSDVIEAWFGAEHGSDIFADAGRDPAEVGMRHFNEAGYAMLAQAVADRLVSDGRIAASAATPTNPVRTELYGGAGHALPARK